MASLLHRNIDMSNLAEVRQVRQDLFSQVVSESMRIKRHFELLMWAQGDLQAFLPHDVMLAAYGDFANRRIRYDVVSAIPGIRTAKLAHIDIENLILGLFERWLNHGRTPFSLGTTTGLVLHSSCECELHRIFRSMRSVLVHGTRDERSGEDSLYVLFLMKERVEPGTRKMFDLLLPHIDFASRRVAGLACSSTLKNGTASPAPGLEQSGLTDREIEILGWVKNGKTNFEIGMILNISAFTVKNHMQRIFRKINVSNRAQAVSMFDDLTRRGQ